MKLINKDLTKEKIEMFITNNQIFVKIFHKETGKWTTSTYFQSYDFSIDEELISSTIKYITYTWSLKAPVVEVIIK